MDDISCFVNLDVFHGLSYGILARKEGAFRIVPSNSTTWTKRKKRKNTIDKENEGNSKKGKRKTKKRKKSNQ